jgi:hypothetical protein
MEANYSECSRLLELLSYDAETGAFSWKRTRAFTACKGARAGGRTAAGYIRIKIDGREFGAHRLAWMLVHGPIPDGLEIDHINGVRDDNRIVNLRLANAVQQRANAKVNADSTSGVRGVYWNKRRQKWRAHIQRQHIGYFESKDAAAAAYAAEFDMRFGAEFKRQAANG